MGRKSILYVLPFVLPLLHGCLNMGPDAAYSNDLHTLSVRLVYPEGKTSFMHEGVEVSFENYASGVRYILKTDASGKVAPELTNGIYRISASDKVGNSIFNGNIDKALMVGSDVSVDLNLVYSEAGDLLIKEIYCGGCSMAPKEGVYQSDKYVIVHNNSPSEQYLDSLCIGTIAPYNSNSTPIQWSSDGELPPFAPVILAVLRVGGNGKSFPLQSGEDAIFCLNGAIDHTVNYPLSVNLNRPDCFVCYNTTYFPNPIYHPAPGDKVSADRILKVVIKTGIASAYTLSNNSPAIIIFRAKGKSINEFVASPDNIIQIPGSFEKVVKIPLEWVIDGVEVFNGSSTSNSKRLGNSIDAGFVSLSETYKGKTLMRKKDDRASAENGYEVLFDTNNSTNDLYESKVQSLHK